MHQGGPHDEACLADADAVADAELEPRQQPRGHHGAPAPTTLRERRGERLYRVEGDLAVKGIGAVDRLELDQAALGAVLGARHRPQLHGLRHFAAACDISALLGRCRAVDEMKFDVAPEHGARIRLEARVHRG
jgi:hypothetical protein